MLLCEQGVCCVYIRYVFMDRMHATLPAQPNPRSTPPPPPQHTHTYTHTPTKTKKHTKTITKHNAAVALVVVRHPSTGKYLAVEEQHDKGWWLPAGHVDPNETFAQVKLVANDVKYEGSYNYDAPPPYSPFVPALPTKQNIPPPRAPPIRRRTVKLWRRRG